jgi:hypothetical protein
MSIIDEMNTFKDLKLPIDGTPGESIEVNYKRDKIKVDKLAEYYIECGDFEEALVKAEYAPLKGSDHRKRVRTLRASKRFKQALREAVEKHYLRVLADVSLGRKGNQSAIKAAETMCRYYIGEVPTFRDKEDEDEKKPKKKRTW